MHNDLVEMSFDAYGQLTQMKDLRSGTSLLTGTPCGFYLTVNVGTGDIWQTARGKELMLTAQDAPAEIQLIKQDNVQILDIRQTFQLEDGQIIVHREVTLEDTCPVARFDMHIQNACDHAVVVRAETVRLEGLNDSKQGRSLLWPYQEGQIYAGALQAENQLTKALNASYPSPMSMQYAALYDDTSGLYYGVHDEKRWYKTFSFSNVGMLSCEQWPLISAQQAGCTAPVYCGVTEGGWHEAAELYRSYLLAQGFIKAFSPMAQQFSGIAACNLSRYKNRYEVSYLQDGNDLKNMRQAALEHQAVYKTNLTIYLGWHENGFDSMYPDYSFIEAYGGESAFRQAMDELNEINHNAAMYLNLHIADTRSNWYNAPSDQGMSQGEASAIRTKYGSVLHEEYGTGLDYVAMCPMASNWQRAIVEAVERLRRNGADALWMDQLMEMPANLCYNQAHDHSNPASAYAEGYDSLLAQIDAVMSSYGSDYLYCCEGICDAYIRYIDLCGLMWARLLGYNEQAAPEITRYTMPAKIFGLPNAGAQAGTQSQYGLAWIMADGMLARDSNPVCGRFSKLMQTYPQVYGSGRWLDSLGINSLPNGVHAGVLLEKGTGQAAIQLWNEGEKLARVTLCPDAQVWGYAMVTQAINAETGKALNHTSDGWEITVPGGSVAAVMLTLQ